VAAGTRERANGVVMTDRIGDGIDPASGYIRGGAGRPTEPRQVGRTVLIFLAVAMVALIIGLAVNAAHQNSRERKLASRGVPVTATVTSCLGTATGTGITVNGFVCRGSFVLGGHRYTDVIRGISSLKQRGDIVQGVTDPRSPRILSTTAVVAAARPSWHAYLASILLSAALLLIAALGWLRSQRRVSRPHPAAQ
jgi:hypothetical protein